MIQFTKSKEEGTPDPSKLLDDVECTDSDFVFIRKFCSVSDFLQRVRTLDNVLETIESFTSEVASYQKPGKIKSGANPASDNDGALIADTAAT